MTETKTKRYKFIYEIESVMNGSIKSRVYSCIAEDIVEAEKKWKAHKALQFLPYGSHINLIRIEKDSDYVNVMEITRWIIDGDSND